MIRPVNFRLNEETAVNNYYQQALEGITSEEIRERSQQEFDVFVEKLRKAGVEVIVINDTEEPQTPDSIFPNNWVSFHQDGRVGLYPMFAANRRQERRNDILETLTESYGLKISEVVDFSYLENEGRFLEGTGSIVMDRDNRVAYAALSERTDAESLRRFCKEFNYSPVTFTAYQTVGEKRLPIYHTNVMMCVADQFAILCADCIDDQEERAEVIRSLKQSGKEVIYISEEQKNRFAGNMLQVHARGDENAKFLVMSGAAFTSLTPDQKQAIEKYGDIIYSSLDTIEALGGGSARCMMAEVFLPPTKA